MSTTFDLVIDRVLAHEGGFVDHPDDPGGATNFGISLRWLAKQGQLGDMDLDGDVDVDDIRSLTVEDAKRLYRRFFWAPVYDQLPQEVAYRVFDHRVNAGRKSAHIVLQRACRGHGRPLAEDGVIGPKTLAAVLAIGDAVVPALRSERAGFYRSLVAGNNRFKAFLNGWLNRAYS